MGVVAPGEKKKTTKSASERQRDNSCYCWTDDSV